MLKSDYKNMWVYIEHDGRTAEPVGLELCCELRRLCGLTGDRLYAVIVGSLPAAEEEKIIDCGIDGIIRVSGTGYDFLNTDAYANAFTVLSRKYNPSAIFVGGTIFGRDFAPASPSSSTPAAPPTPCSSTGTPKPATSSSSNPP